MKQTVRYLEVPGLPYSVIDGIGSEIPEFYAGAQRCWYHLKQWCEERGYVLPTSREFSSICDWLDSAVPETRGMISAMGSWTDSLVAFPDPHDGSYPFNLSPTLKPGEYPVLIEGATITPSGSGVLYVHGGEREQLTELKEVARTHKIRLDKPSTRLGLKEGTPIRFLCASNESTFGVVVREGSGPNESERRLFVGLFDPITWPFYEEKKITVIVGKRRK